MSGQQEGARQVTELAMEQAGSLKPPSKVECFTFLKVYYGTFISLPIVFGY